MAVDAEFHKMIEDRALAPLTDAMRVKDKLENYGQVDEVLAGLIDSLGEAQAERKGEAKSIFKGLQQQVLRDDVLDRGVRLDGRKFDEVRPVWI